jgi:predicted transcriptional regulator
MKNLLTPLEREILVLIAKGKSASEVGKILKVTKAAVEAHVKSSAHKLRVADRSHKHSKRSENTKALEDRKEDSPSLPKQKYAAKKTKGMTDRPVGLLIQLV